jgi:leader peptidase (prepilin peptidase)/N-methyltransferase
MEIYDALSIGGMFVGFVCSMISPELMCEFSRYEAIRRSFIGACFGSGLMLWIAVLSEIIFKREAVGFGDVKLMGLIGAFAGVDGSMFSIFGGCLIGSVILVPLLLIKNFSKNKRILKSREIPFAPFLVVGSISYMIFFNQTCSDMLMYFSF